MKALILAGGFGIRLKELIHDRPKVMAPVNSRPFLDYVVEILRKNDIDEVVISLGYLGDFIKNHFGDGKKFGLTIHYSEEEYPLGTGGAVKQAEKFFGETFLVVNGDTYFNTNLKKVVAFHRKQKAGVTIVLTERKSTFETGSVLLEKSGQITTFLEKPEKDRSGWVSCGYYVFAPRVLKFISKHKRISLEKDIFPLLAQKGVLYGFRVSEDFIDIGTPKSYRKAKEILSKKKRKIIEARAPVRISFAGGGSDLPSYFFKEKGYVVSSTIDRYAHVTLTTQDVPQIRIILEDYQKEEDYPLNKFLPYDGSEYDLYKAIINRLGLNSGVIINVKGDFPAVSGLGSSSAVTVASIGAILKLKNQKLTKEKVAKLAIEIEREILKIPGGWQDQYASAFGGINFIEFLPRGKVKVSPLPLAKGVIKKLENNLLLFYLGSKRSEKSQQKFLSKKIKQGGKTKKALDALRELAVEVRDALKKGEIGNFGALLHKAWLAKKQSSSQISTGLVDRIYNLAIKNGAKGGKLLGAGGGGCLLLNVSPKNKKNKEKIIRVLEKNGAKLLPFKFEFEGLRVEAYEN